MNVIVNESNNVVTPAQLGTSMEDTVTDYAFAEIVSRKAVFPQFIFTATAKEIAGLREKPPQSHPVLVAASPFETDAMLVKGYSGSVFVPDLRAEKDLTAVFATLAAITKEEGLSAMVRSWNGRPDPDEEAGPIDDYIDQASYTLSGDEVTVSPVMSGTESIAEAAAQFYQNIIDKTDLSPDEPSDLYTFRVFARYAVAGKPGNGD